MFILALMFCTTIESDTCRQFIYKDTFATEDVCLVIAEKEGAVFKKKLIGTLDGKEPYRWETACVPMATLKGA